MTRLDPRAPVLVGAAQRTHRAADGPPPAPHGLAAAVVQAAAQDAGAGGTALLARLDSLAVVDPFSWPVGDPAALVAAELGLTPGETVRSVVGGNGPVALLGDLAARIQDGRLDVAVLAGAEVGTAFFRASRTGEALGWPTQPEGTRPTRVIGEDRPPAAEAELRAGLIAPIFAYPLVEHALRGAAGRSREEHLDHLGRLWSRFAAQARANPHAWTTDPPLEPDALARPGEGNRLVSDPYPKALNANIQVDQAAALVLCSVQAARDAGIDPARWVFVEATAGAHDHWFVTSRARLDRSPAIAATTRAVLGHARLEIDDVAHLDLYSCFPSAVQVAAAELGIDPLDPGRSPTATGGLTFAGGPANNYVTHALATLVERVRADPGARALATAVGWYLTKHGVALLSGDPPARPFAHHAPQDEVDRGERVALDASAGPGTVESHTAIFDRDGRATMGLVAARRPDGSRALARSHDPAAIAAVWEHDPLGAGVELDGEGGYAL